MPPVFVPLPAGLLVVSAPLPAGFVTGSLFTPVLEVDVTLPSGFICTPEPGN